jgi:sigma-B regulation protein RsbU (phosphoserine phosphatase)
MKNYHDIEQRLQATEEDLTLAKGLLSLYYDKLDTLLLLTESVNKNFSANAILSLFENSLKHLIKAENYVLLLKNNAFEVVRQNCTLFDFPFSEVENDLSKIYKTQEVKNHKNNNIAKFDYIVPVLHKNKFLAFLFLKNIQSHEIDFSEIQKLRYIETILNLTIISLENKKLSKKNKYTETNEDLILAAEVQAELIPNIFPKNADYEFFGRYIPYDIVGGDYYDIIELDDDNTAFCICDVSGKGISAGMLMSNFQASLRTLLSRKLHIVDLVTELNTKFLNVTKQNHFITMFIAIYDKKTRQLRYINAGHNPPILKNGNEIVLLKKGCTILGMLPNLGDFNFGEILLAKDAILLMYTDGLSEIKNNANEDFDSSKIEAYLLANTIESIPYIVNNLIDTVETYKGENEIFDDISVLCGKFF